MKLYEYTGIDEINEIKIRERPLQLTHFKSVVSSKNSIPRILNDRNIDYICLSEIVVGLPYFSIKLVYLSIGIEKLPVKYMFLPHGFDSCP